MKKCFYKIIGLVAVICLGIGVVINVNTKATKVVADQHLDDYDPYYYSGSYYSIINFNDEEGENGDLRVSLTSLIKPAGFYTYSGSGATHLSTQCQYADEDPTNPNNMVYLYTRNSVPKSDATVNGTVIWNREHVWCQSLSSGNWGTSEGGTDLLHLRPVYASTNSSRNNNPYGDTGKAKPKYYNDMLYGYLSGGYFEPIDSVKGDVARIVMYLWTTYTGWPGYSALDITKVFKNYDTMLSWHTLDKPDVLEGNRNDYVQTSRQKNRNPFVDHPELAWKIFGERVSSSVKNACMEAYPEEGVTPIEATGIALNKASASLSVGSTLQLRANLEPSGASGAINWSSSNNDVASVSGGLVTANSVGEAVITATVGAYSDTCTITVTPQSINYGSEEDPLSITDAIEVINHTGDSLTAQPLYVKGIVSSNTVYSDKYSNYSYLWLQSDDGKTAQAFELYRPVADSSITSTYSAANSLVGKEIVAYGYGTYYNSSTYELTTSTNDPANPTILSVAAPSATNITLNRETADVNVGETVTLTATLTPNGSNSPITWESSDETIATVNNGVVTGVKAGTAVITARVSEDIEAQCVVSVIGVTTASLEIATSINVGDTVYLGCNATSTQYNGPSDSGTNAYGTYLEFDEAPDVDTYPLEVCEGSSNATYAFKIKDGTYANYYLAWSGEKNSLKVTTTLDSNSSWLVTIDSSGNATIANAANNDRVIWWNVASPRFACYIGKTNGGSFKYVQFWKESVSPTNYLSSITSIAMIGGNEGTYLGNHTENFIFANAGLDDATNISGLSIGDVTLNGAKGTHANQVPKYYTNGNNMRIYVGNTITFTAAHNISRIEFVFTSTYENGLTVDIGTLENGVWTGDASSVTFTNTNDGSQQVRITRINITYEKDLVSVSSVYMRFGVTISKDNWNTINDSWPISDYGVMLVKKETLEETYHVSTVKEAYEAGETLKIVNKGSNEAPYAIDEDNYVFTAKLNMTQEANYDVIYCAAPFIVADGNYYFFREIRYSVNTLASYYLTNGGADLSDDALRVLMGN